MLTRYSFKTFNGKADISGAEKSTIESSMTGDGIRDWLYAAQVSVGRCELEKLSIVRQTIHESQAWNQVCSAIDPFHAFSGGRLR